MKIKVTKTGPRHGSVAWVRRQEEIHGGLECILWANPWGAFVTLRLQDNKQELLQVPLQDDDSGFPADYSMEGLRSYSGQYCVYLGVPAVTYLFSRIDWESVQREYEADDVVGEVGCDTVRPKDPDYPECSGDPSCCPENEGYGCCGKFEGKTEENK